MYFIYDHLNAAIIGVVVAMMFVALQVRIRELNVEQTATYMVKREAISLSDWMEEDLLRMGRDVSVDVPFGNPLDSAGVTTEFTFFRDTVDTDVTPHVQHRYFTRYKLHRQGIRIVKDDTISVYRIQRSTKIDNGVWQLAGGSSGLLSHFRIQLLNRDGIPVSTPASLAMVSPDTVRNTRVRFTMATPFETQRSTVRQVYYGSTLLIRE